MDHETNLTPEEYVAATDEVCAEATEISETTAEIPEEITAETAAEPSVADAVADKPWNTTSEAPVEVIYDGDKPWQGTVIEREVPAAVEAIAEIPEQPEGTEEEYDYEYDGRPEEDDGEYIEGDKPWQCKGQGTIASKYAPCENQDKPWK